MGPKHYFKEKYFQEMENECNFVILKRKIFYKPSKSIMFARRYAKKTGAKKTDYRKLIVKQLLKIYQKN